MLIEAKKNSLFVLIFVVLLISFVGYVQGVQVNLKNISDVNLGSTGIFNVVVDLEQNDTNFTFDYGIFNLNGPNNFSESCQIFNNGSVVGCDNLSVKGYIEFHENSTTNGSQPLNPVPNSSREIVLTVNWNTQYTDDTGNYSLNVTGFSGNNSYYGGEQNFQVISTLGVECRKAIQLYKDSRSPNYDVRMDFDNDTLVDVMDLGYLAQNLDNESWCASLFPLAPVTTSGGSSITKGNGIAGDPSKKFRINQSVEEEAQPEEEIVNTEPEVVEETNEGNQLTGAAVFFDNIRSNPVLGILILLILVLIYMQIFAKRKPTRFFRKV